ncbi:MAG: DUF1365 domain-containing protein [Thermoleophilia bacterium]
MPTDAGDRTGAALYRGTVAHERLTPRKNSFRYGIYFLYLDLAEIDCLAKSLRLFSHNRFNLFSLHDRDHGPRDGTAPAAWIETVLADAEIDLEGGRVMLLAFPRVLGFRFFPVSFWYCHHRDGTLRAVLAEVNNTFRQNHNYLLHKEGRPLIWGEQLRARKVFYVSPFIVVNPIEYHFAIAEPDGTLAVAMDVLQEERPLLLAKLKLSRRGLTDMAIIRTFIRYGPMSLRARILIYWQAAWIRLKGMRVVPRPPAPKDRTS